MCPSRLSHHLLSACEDQPTLCAAAQNGVSSKEDASLLSVIECLERAADGNSSNAGPPPEDERRNRRLSAWRERFTRAPSTELLLVQRAASADSRLNRVQTRS